MLRNYLNQKLGYGIATPEQLLLACKQARQYHQNSSIEYNTLSTMEAIIQTSKLQARDIMIPRSKMVVIQKDIKQEELLKLIQKNPHSRFPIVSDQKERVVGVLIAKDVLYHLASASDSKFNLRRLSRPAKVIPESKCLSFLLKEFRHHRTHMAIVINEFGEISGLITIEDVLEQIVGDILDEYDSHTQTYYLQYKKNLFTIKSSMPIKELAEVLKLDIEQHLKDAQANTVGGWLVEYLGYNPKQFEKITIGNLQFRILRADEQRIKLVELIVGPETLPASSDLTENHLDQEKNMLATEPEHSHFHQS